MTALAEFAMLSHGWRRALLMILAGAIAALSVAPLFILPALFIGLPLLVWTLDGAERRKGIFGRIFGPAFRIGFWFGLGYFTASLHWLGFAFFVDGGWLIGAMPLAIAGLAAILSIFWGLGTAVAHLLWAAGATRIFALTACLSLAELARGTLFTGFPFNLLGYALTANAEMMQAASLVGIYGLTFAAILVAATPALVWPGADRSIVSRLLPLFGGFGLIALQLGWGYQRLANTTIEYYDDTVIRLVQPAVPQDDKWQVFAREEIVTRLIDLSTMRTGPDDRGLEDVDILLWPEAALPFFLSQEPQYLAQIARMLPEGTVLLTGAPREPYGPDGTIIPGAQPYNAILAINADGEVVTSYDKTHLVPFGEYLPFQSFFSRFGIGQFVYGSDGWAAGEARRLIELPGLPAVLPLICYEIVYSGGLGALVADAAFILVVTNDAWFDGSIGPAQHFHHARLRAVEEGKSMVRAANSGISAFVDPLGRIGGMLGQEEVGVLKGVPARPVEATFFAQVRNIPFFGFILAGLLLPAAGLWVGRRKRI
ncbi:apolipoprotein N-acyltransferase [Pelagibacterium limicola]|uniref:apolipoprotein N-acyltransferase n=1 Tax=Pelagibacterium limicola TaxID=2791022 RepID=UPI0018B00A8E|nr:apolipoprotein N-acyltransferase [Pelagibacterium limicola]